MMLYDALIKSEPTVIGNFSKKEQEPDDKL